MSSKRSTLLVSAVTLALTSGGVGLLGAWRGAARGRAHGEGLGREATALLRCIDAASPEALRSRLSLSPPGASPLASCQPAAERLEAHRAALAAERRRRSGDLAPALEAASRAVREFPLDGPALDLSRRSEALASALQSLLAGSCEAAVLEGAPACPAAAPPAAPPAARVLLDEPSATRRAAWVATTDPGQLSVRVVADQAFELTSTDGERFARLALPGPSLPDEGAPQLVLDGARRFLLRMAPGQAGRVFEARAGGAVDGGALPPLPAGYGPASGVGAVRLGEGWLRVGRDGEGRGALIDREGKARQAPEGELVGAFHEGGPRLLLKRQGKTSFVDLVVVGAAAPGEPWGPEVVTTVAHVPGLAIAPGPERGCGLDGERYATLVGTQGDEGALVAFSSRKIHAFRFHAEPGALYSPLCGSCPPMGVEARAGDLGVFVPVRRALTPARLKAPMAYERGRSAASVSASCTPSRMVVLYEAEGRILAQQREGDGWAFGEPRVIAERDGLGAPVEPVLLGVGERLVAVWRRDAPGRVRIEALTL